MQSSLSRLRAFIRGVSRGTFPQVCQSLLTCPSACPRGELRMKSVGAKTSISATASSFSWKRWEDESCLPSAASNFSKFQFHLLPEHRESEWPTEAALQASLRSCNCLQSIKTASLHWNQSQKSDYSHLNTSLYTTQICLFCSICTNSVFYLPLNSKLR